MRPRHLALAAMLGLAACAGDDTWFGASEGPPLAGERVSVMLLERDLAADPSLADLPIELPPPRRNDSWPQSGGDPTHAMHHLAAADQLSLAWSAGIGQGSSDDGQLLARPVVAEGRVFTMDAEGTIRSFDAENGALAWEITQDEELEDGVIGGGLAYADGWVFATLSSGHVVGLDAATGSERWRQPLAVPLRAAPTVAEERVLVLTADNQLYALERATGRPVWRHAGFFEGAGLLGGPSPAVDRGLVVVPYSSAEVFALRLDNGRPLWSDTVERPRRTQALDQISPLPRLTNPDDPGSTPIVWSGPILVGDRLLVVGSNDQAVTMSPYTGEILGRQELPGPVVIPPIAAAGVVYMVTENGELLAYR
jgi:outer membrane protein assembly factor BamB